MNENKAIAVVLCAMFGMMAAFAVAAAVASAISPDYPDRCRRACDPAPVVRVTESECECGTPKN